MTLAIAAMLLVSTTVAVTVAYLTAETKVVTNTFTVGDVKIGLNEADVDLYGVKIPDADPERVTENEYKLIPGHTYVKDPTVYVEKGSEECYVFVKVENGLTAIESTDEDYVSIAAQMSGKGWKPLEVDEKDGENVFYYKDKVNVLEAKENASLIVFENFTIDGNAVLTDENGEFLYADKEITIDAYAIQADGFGSAAEAWAAAPSTWE